LVKNFNLKSLSSIVWSSDDDFGRPLSAGVYFMQLKAEDFSAIKKIIKVE